jgi:hypothetical protein
VQDPSQLIGEILWKYRTHKTSEHFKTRKGEYLKDEICNLATRSKNSNIRDLYIGINEFETGYQPIIDMVNDENGDLLADSHNSLNRWKNDFSQLLNACRFSDVMQKNYIQLRQ